MVFGGLGRSWGDPQRDPGLLRMRVSSVPITRRRTVSPAQPAQAPVDGRSLG
jgi:hypothetical protein